jgi:hypothetical protein
MAILRTLRGLWSKPAPRAYKTDKVANDLLGEYQRIFQHLIARPITVLEVGLYRGDSLRIWDDLFTHPQTRIIGVDRRIPVVKGSSRIVTRECDQNDTAGLTKIAKEFGPFDIVIDDASHMPKETQNTFDVFFPHVVQGGYYGIEDWGVGYWGDRLPEYNGMVELVTRMIQNVPTLGIGKYRIIADGGNVALFQKDTTPFKDRPMPPGGEAAEKHYAETVTPAAGGR